MSILGFQIARHKKGTLLRIKKKKKGNHVETEEQQKLC